MSENTQSKMTVTATLSHHEAVYNQLAVMRQLATDLKADRMEVNHSHRSKSIDLPVTTLEWSKLRGGITLKFMIRDNFHDLNLFVQCGEKISLPLEVFYKKRDFAWYLEQIESNKGYCYGDWSDEEMDDPRILRVLCKNGNGWKEVKGEEKDRWTARMSSTAWHNKDWSSGELLHEGPVPFNEQTTFYKASYAFAEGIPESAPAYKEPCTRFILSLNNLEELRRITRAIIDHIESK